MYYTIFVVAISYSLWDFAMQGGKVVMLGIVSYLLPLMSTLFAAWYFHEPPGRHLLAGAVLVMLGAVLSRLGIITRAYPKTLKTL